MINIFSWEDFKQFNVPPETLARYCNHLLQERTVPVKACQHGHDLVREDAGYDKEHLAKFPKKARMTRPE